MDSKTLSLFHILFVVPLLYAIYRYRDRLTYCNCRALLVLSLGGILYHISRLNQRLKENRNSSTWINLLHILIVFPLLFVISINCKEKPRYLFELVLMLSFAALGYHLYYLKY
jgi:hypothetical protein